MCTRVLFKVIQKEKESNNFTKRCQSYTFKRLNPLTYPVEFCFLNHENENKRVKMALYRSREIFDCALKLLLSMYMYLVPGFIQASLRGIQGLFKDVQKTFIQSSRTTR